MQPHRERLERREFLVRSALLAGGLLGGVAASRQARADGAASTVAEDGAQRGALQRRDGAPLPVAIARGRAPALRHGMGQRMGELFCALDFERELRPAGKTVLIKPSLAWNRLPEEGANVHPETLRAVIELFLEAGASRVVVADRTAAPARLVHARSGAELVVSRIAGGRVELKALAEADFTSLPSLGADASRAAAAPRGSLPEGPLDTYRVARALLEADLVVNVATPRRHPTRGASLALSNLRGLWGGGAPDPRWEELRELEPAILAAAVRSDLTVLDAVRGVVRNGPAGCGSGDVAVWNTLVASRDPVAVEAWAAGLFGLEPSGLPQVALAEELGLGSSALLASRMIEIG